MEASADGEARHECRIGQNHKHLVGVEATEVSVAEMMNPHCDEQSDDEDMADDVCPAEPP